MITISITVLTLTPGMIYIDGYVEAVDGATLTYDPATTSGADYVYVELLKYNYGYTQDPSLINPATGEPTAEREKWVLALKTAKQTNKQKTKTKREQVFLPCLRLPPLFSFSPLFTKNCVSKTLALHINDCNAKTFQRSRPCISV